MDYELSSLGSRNFEHLSQSLAAEFVASNLSIFGDGPDGGREATWDGQATSFGKLAAWNGYGVVQAKFQVNDQGPTENLKWLKKAITKELGDWAKASTKRTRKPDFLLFVTNTKLSPSPGSGKDAARAHMKAKITELSLPIRDFGILDFQEVRVMLDRAEDIRNRYSNFITPATLIAELVARHEWERKDFSDVMNSYVARALVDDNALNLTQAGAAGDATITMADVFIDLPFAIDHRTRPSTGGTFLGAMAESRQSGVAATLVAELDEAHPGDFPQRGDRYVLIGGPGQGKSTVTQWLAQLYRARFLNSSGTNLSRPARTTALAVERRARTLGSHLPGGVRWPFRVALSDLADFLAKHPDDSLVHYMAHKISVRSSVTVASSDLRQWLRNIPSVLLIDGLDEVPESSNRKDVLERISDFFSDVEIMGADVAAVATTRPQGYSDEFSHDEYQHLRLTPLGVDESLAYAETVVSIRSGVGTDHTTKVMRRLTDASQDDATLRFFETPLQVTILCILLEKIGKAPRDRARLFSTYYEVIAQREQEKSGSLSQLLQRYESDVRELHRTAGLTLQQRASAAGETDATLSLMEFEQMVSTQFDAQGHTEQVITELSADFTQLITDRLVFLSVVKSDRIGFELRSLQEYMAAEQIIHRREADIMPAITEIAPIPYWRNVVLFAVGGIFADREHLRAEVLVMCGQLNAATEESRVMLPGSELALDILVDGSCDSMPRYAAPIARVAAEMIRRPTNRRLLELGSLREESVRNAIFDEASEATPATLAVRANRILTLGMIATEGDQRALPAIRRAIDQLTDADLQSIWPVLIEYGIGDVLDIAVDRLTVANPIDILEHLAPWDIGTEPSFPAPFQHLAAISRWNSDDAHYVMDGLSYGYVTLRQAEKAWENVSEIAGGDEAWDALRAIGAFSVAPDQKSLADALRALQSTRLNSRPLLVPWPLAACIGAATSGEVSYSERMGELTEMSLRGELGGPDDWVAAEASLETPAKLELSHITRVLEDADANFPLAGSPAIVTGFAPPPLSWALQVSITFGQKEWWTLAAGDLLKMERRTFHPLAQRWAREIALSLASTAFSSFFREPDPEKALRSADDFISWTQERSVALTQEGIQTWLEAADSLPWDVRWEQYLEQQNVSRATLRRGKIPDGLLTAVRAGRAGVGLIRLLAASAPSSILVEDTAEIVATQLDRHDAGESSLALAIRLYLAHSNAWSSDVDGLAARLASCPDPLGMSWLTAVFRDHRPSTRGLSARIARDLADIDPMAADRFGELNAEIETNRPI